MSWRSSALGAVADEQPDGHGGDYAGDVKLLGRHVGGEAGDVGDRDAEQVVADDPPEDPQQDLGDDHADRHATEHVETKSPVACSRLKDPPTVAATAVR